MDKKSKSSLMVFAGLISLALIVSMIPIVNWPFSWMMTFFHEISHGIAALLTGGSVVKINLYLNGAGLCTTRGGIGFIISFAGYMGAVIWGGCIYIMAEKLNKRHTDEMALVLSGIILLSGIFWARDIMTIIIMIVMICLLLSVIKLQNNSFIKLAIKFIGVYVLLDAVKAPLNLVDGRHRGDGAALADMTGIPEVVWVSIWLVFGILGLVYLWRSHR